MHPTRLPLLSEVRRVPVAEMREHGQTVYLLHAMKHLGVGCFVDELGTYWFGASDPDHIEHDRWLYALKDWQLSERGYTSTGVGIIHGCTLDDWVRPGTLDVVQSLSELDLIQTQVLGAVGWASRAERQVLARNFLVAARELGLLIPEQKIILGPERMVPATRIRWTQAQHDILHHWDTWCEANNPDGLPRELVLRMHGLGAYANSREPGNQWLHRDSPA
jgi:hypothetical protein